MEIELNTYLEKFFFHRKYDLIINIRFTELFEFLILCLKILNMQILFFKFFIHYILVFNDIMQQIYISIHFL